MPYRIGSAILGFWLMLSPFTWHHAAERGFNDFVVGCILFLSGCCGMYLRSSRFFDGLLGAWMVATFFVMRAEFFTGRLHDAILGLVVMALAAIPGSDAAAHHDHWVAEFDDSPRLDRRSLFEQEIEG